MKISRLFHWLYAFLMFLPILFLVPTLAYYGFNKNATAQEKTELIEEYYQTNEITGNGEPDDLVHGNVYRYTFNSMSDFFVYCEDIFIVSVPSQPTTTIVADDNSKFIRCYDHGSCDVAFGDGIINVYRYLGSGSIVLDFVFDYYRVDNNIMLTSACPVQHLKEYSNVTYTMSITDSVNQAINDIFDLPMFSWTSDNFIIVPFNYITDLFGLPDGNVINKYLDYWLSISIIYLCFDVIMYVPLLVHRWIDKARIE